MRIYIIATLEELQAPEEYLENENYIKPIEDLDRGEPKYLEVEMKPLSDRYLCMNFQE